VKENKFSIIALAYFIPRLLVLSVALLKTKQHIWYPIMWIWLHYRSHNPHCLCISGPIFTQMKQKLSSLFHIDTESEEIALNSTASLSIWFGSRSHTIQHSLLPLSLSSNWKVIFQVLLEKQVEANSRINQFYSSRKRQVFRLTVLCRA